ncbi:hypothetical protein NPX13_g11167 [Xylaria arbuscula]|uniref:Xylanolytic transcriptional activator regulatory domain-containing protein n=1 Tax=Xylaria arbuscula TaxID=114810 RepID=A0A9W8TFV9_9PEZI|nr:hypothetical protein NPX13_g11167 [Xylaria arbuscula]
MQALKRQKKTDSRVAELEKKIDALTATLKARNSDEASGGDGGDGGGAHSHPQSTPMPQPHRSAAEASTTRIAKEWGPPMFPPMDSSFREDWIPPQSQPGFATNKRKFAATKDSGSDAQRGPGGMKNPAPGPKQPWRDVVDRGVITMDEVPALFQRYTDRMAVHLPAVVFPPGTTAAEIRTTSPILFLSIMSVASSEEEDKQRLLVQELMEIFADEIIIRGHKSLELIQALVISVVWYFPPDHFEELKFYQMVHLAAVMALDIGLGRRKNNPKSNLIPYTWRDHPFRTQPLPDPSTIESRRTWLAVYFLASNVAMALHRPNLIRWQSFMTECMDILESSPEAAPSDRFLCHLVWTHRLAEEVGIQFSMDDPSIFVNITEQKVQYALRGFERDLVKYSESIPEEDKKPTLLLSFSVMSLYMHEIALQSNEERAVPSSTEALAEPIAGLRSNLTPAHISALSSCLMAIDAIFEVFLSLDEATIRCLPIFNLVRITYALVVLLKIYFSASSPNSELGKVINKENMKVTEYIQKLHQKFEDTQAVTKSRPASKFRYVLNLVGHWFSTLGERQGQQNEDEKKNIPKPAPPSRSSSVANTSSSQDARSNANTTHHQQPQIKTPLEYNSANTPLQLLSEIATGNAPPRHPHNSGTPLAASSNTLDYPPNWMDPAQMAYLYGPRQVLPTSAPAETTMGGSASQPLNMSWAPGAFGGDMNYLHMGDGFEQAMGITLTGFGGISPDENLRMAAQNDPNLMNLFNEFPPANGNPFGF